MKKKSILSAFMLLIMSLVYNCSNPRTCLVEYGGKVDYSRGLHLTIDPLLQSESGCEYLVSTVIYLKESFIAKALMYQQNDKLYLRGIDPVQTEDFILFDFDLIPQQLQEVNIYHHGLRSSFNYSLEKKITVNEDLEVYVFKWSDILSYEEMNMDIVFFVTKEHGVIGSFATTDEDTEEKGEEIMISPGGNILKDYFDYSNFTIGILEL